MNILLLGISVILGFLFWNIVSGKHEGDRPEKSFRLILGEYIIHIHHWIWASILLVICILCKFYNSVIIGFLIGSILQGFTYKDRFVILYKEKDFQKIYSKWRK